MVKIYLNTGDGSANAPRSVRIPDAPGLTVEAIYRAYEAESGDGYRDHMGASGIGHECDRNIWYSWRWATRRHFPGRMLRLFDTGNLAEARFVSDLRKIGVTVLDVDPDTGRQWNVRDASGHFGGSLDGQALGLIEAPKTWHALEFKTHSAKSFKELKAKGVQKAKPMHWAQVQSYMHLQGLTRTFYLAVNKDTEELYQERIKYDVAEATRIVARAQRIIAATVPPSRISEDPAWFVCRLCDHAAVCHGQAAPERHCRSCLSSTPIEAGEWRCERYGWRLVPKMQRSGCSSHRYIPALLVGAEQIDAHPEADWIDYRLPDGTVWRDQGEAQGGTGGPG